MTTKNMILENIRKILQEKGIKVENISKEIGISKGEFSKIMNGQRKDYSKYLHRIAESLNLTYHQLINASSHTNKKMASDFQTDLYERLINECKEKDKAKDDLIKNLYEQIEILKNKYEEMKRKMVDSKSNGKIKANDSIPGSPNPQGFFPNL